MKTVNKFIFPNHKLIPHFFSDWFPGWVGKYGAEPSSKSPSEDCVGLRQSFPGVLRTTQDNNDNVIDTTTNGGLNGLEKGLENGLKGGQIDPPVKKSQLYWSDQECRQENWFICSKRMITLRKEGKYLNQ